MRFHSNQLSWVINYPFINLCFKYHSPGFICFSTMLAPVISSLDEIYCTWFNQHEKMNVFDAAPSSATITQCKLCVGLLVCKNISMPQTIPPFSLTLSWSTLIASVFSSDSSFPTFASPNCFSKICFFRFKPLTFSSSSSSLRFLVNQGKR